MNSVKTRVGDGDLILYVSRSKIGKVVLGQFALVMIGPLLVIQSCHAHGFERLLYLIGGLSSAFFLCPFSFVLRKFFSQEPALVLNAQGLYDNTSLMPAGFVSWSEIATLSLRPIGRQRILSLVPKDIEAFIARYPMHVQKTMRASGRLGGAPINLSDQLLPLSLEELHDEIAARLR